MRCAESDALCDVNKIYFIAQTFFALIDVQSLLAVWRAVALHSGNNEFLAESYHKEMNYQRAHVLQDSDTSHQAGMV